jgi:signal transduction histidine kinase
MSRLFRFYSIASLVSVVFAAAVMLTVSRRFVIDDIVTAAETSNLVTAQIALRAVAPALAEYLAAAGDPANRGAKGGPMPPALEEKVRDLMRDAGAVRIKVYDRAGVVSFSTESRQIGTSQAENPGFLSAMAGRPSVQLVYRDTFNVFDRETEDDNLVQTYIPVRRAATEPVVGVFEMYVDVNALVQRSERSGLLIIVYTLLVVAALYVALLMIVRRARSVIESQQRTISEKTAILASLSQGSLRREERERKKFADELHEGLAQTLSAVKLAVESAGDGTGPRTGRTDLAKSIVPGLQHAIRQARAIAIDLSPLALDDLGLAPTINQLCREFADSHPGVRIELKIAKDDALIPPPLKIVVFRDVEAALKVISERRGVTRIRITLLIREGKLVLVVEADGTAIVGPEAYAALDVETGSPLSAVRQRTIISGGEISVARDKAGTITLHASWPL